MVSSEATNVGGNGRRVAWVLLVLTAIVMPGVTYAAYRSILSNVNKVEDWLPAEFPETRQLGWFRDYFVSDHFVIISWEGATLGDPTTDPPTEDDPRIEALRELLSSDQLVEPSNPEAGTYREWFAEVTTARTVLRRLTGEPSEVPEVDAKSRLAGTLVGADGKTSGVLVILGDRAQGVRLRDAVGRGTSGGFLKLGRPPGHLFRAMEACGIDTETAHVGGPPIDNAAIDEEGERTLVRLAGLSLLLGLGLAWWSLRSVHLTVIVFLCGVASADLAIAMVWLTGESMDAVLLSMPSLVYVLSISGAVHLVNYYRDAVEEHGLQGAAVAAISHGWKPALLCSVTTAIGLASLSTSELAPIRKFGTYSATGVMLMLLILFVMLPAALEVWPVRSLLRRPKSGGKENEFDVHAPKGWLEKALSAMGGGILRHHGVVFALCCLVILGLTGGLRFVKTSVDLLKLFGEEARILQDYRWLEANLGRLIPMELVLRMPMPVDHDEPLDEATAGPRRGDTVLEQLERTDSVARAIRTRFGEQGEDSVGAVLSAATFGPDLDTATGGVRGLARRVATQRIVAHHLPDLRETGYVRETRDGSMLLWRVGLRLAAFREIDHAEFIGQLNETIEPVLIAETEARRLIEAWRVAEASTPPVEGPSQEPRILVWAPMTAGVIGWRDTVYHDTLVRTLRRHRTRVDLLTAPETRLDERQWEALGRFDSIVLLGAVPSELIARVREKNNAVTLVAGPESKSEAPKPTAALTAVELDRPVESTDVVYTGIVPIVYKAQHVLLDSLIDSSLWSFLTITPLMMMVTRGFRSGLIVMIPNVLPVLVVFGGMGWMGIPVDIGSMMSASIALGVAVDDTIHFLTWFRVSLRHTTNRREAILMTYRRCSAPTLQAALISGLGLSVFAFSTFTPTQRFGMLMLTILIAGVIAELVMLPAILAGPMGSVFRTGERTSRRRWFGGNAANRESETSGSRGEHAA